MNLLVLGPLKSPLFDMLIEDFHPENRVDICPVDNLDLAIIDQAILARTRIGLVGFHEPSKVISLYPNYMNLKYRELWPT